MPLAVYGGLTSYEVVGGINILVEIIRKAEQHNEIRKRYPSGAPPNVKERALIPKANAIGLYAQRLGRNSEGAMITSKVYGVSAESRL